MENNESFHNKIRKVELIFYGYGSRTIYNFEDFMLNIPVNQLQNYPFYESKIFVQLEGNVSKCSIFNCPKELKGQTKIGDYSC